MIRLAFAVATFFGCGYFPKGPGTAGSLAALAVIALGYGFGVTRAALLCLLVLLIPVGVWAATKTARTVGDKDPGMVVIDEVLGQWLTLFGAPVWNWKTFTGAFLLFRLFDIWKPQPVRLAEGLPGGIGIVADDLVAGLYAALILYIGAQFRIY
jgi:phosphatidylglycerophosphatase A